MKGGFDEDMAKVIEVLSNTTEALLRTKDLMNTSVFDKNIREAKTALGLCKNLLEDLGEL